MKQQNNRIFAPILFSLALLVLVFLLRPAYTTWMDTRVAQEKMRNTLSQKEDEIKKLLQLQQDFSQTGTTNELANTAEKLDKKWSEADIISAIMLNDFTRGSEFVDPLIMVSTISVNKGKKLPSGLSLGTVNLSLTGKSIDDIINYLTFLTTSSSHIFVIDTITLPISTPTQKEINNLTLSISVGVYYFE